MQLNTALILAGGFGTRLKTVVADLPKPMAPIDAEPFLNYQLRYLKHYGIKQVVLCTGHLADHIRNYYGNSFENVQITYSHEAQPLGTGGACRQALENIKEEKVLVLNGDSFFDVDLNDFSKNYFDSKSQVALALRKVGNASRYGQIELDKDKRIISFSEKSNEEKEGLINGGIYLLDKKTFLQNCPSGAFSIEKDFFEKKNRELMMKGFEYGGYFIDIGIPEDYAKAQDDFKGFKYQ